MTNKFIAILLAAFSLAACNDDVEETDGHAVWQDSEAAQNVRLSKTQAEAFARLMSASRRSGAGGNKTAEVKPEISSMSCYIDGQDTLLYAFNYGNGNGYSIVSGSLTSLHVLTQADSGSVDFNTLNKDEAFYFYVSQAAQNVKRSLTQADNDTARISLWADLGSEDWEYEVEAVPADSVDANDTGNKRTLTSSGLSYIHPYTGMALKDWSQNKGYNYATPKNAKIGCVPLAIGMLLYDITWRPDGTSSRTEPSFAYQDQYEAFSKSVSLKLKKIADKIPAYEWKEGQGRAQVWAFNDYLRYNGFPNVGMVDFDLQTAYNSMCVKETIPTRGSGNHHRGILLFGGSSDPATGEADKYHLWFCDGYKEVAYKVTKYKKFLKWRKKKKSWIEYENQFFMNWGFEKVVDTWAVIEDNIVKGSSFNNSLMIVTGLNEY